MAYYNVGIGETLKKKLCSSSLGNKQKDLKSDYHEYTYKKQQVYLNKDIRLKLQKKEQHNTKQQQSDG